MFSAATIKSIQDIMRQDVGVDGDAQRLNQLVWLVFLKILDDGDKALEIRNKKYTPTLPKELQWSTWAGEMDGMTGDELTEFVNDTLIPKLRDLPKNNNPRTDLVRSAFKDVYNFMRKGTLLRQVINKINEIDFNTNEDRHHFNEVYERLLKLLQSAGNFGEMYTPRALTEFIVEMVDPKLGETVLDPAAGTGGFLVHTLDHLRKQVKTIEDEEKAQNSVMGVEKKPLPYILLLTNMMLHDVESPTNMKRGNTLERPLRDYGDPDRVDCIVTNPPFGGTEEPGIETNFPQSFRTRETADLFLVLITHLLKNNGRAGMVLPDSFLQGETGVKANVKKDLLEKCNLHTIVKIPKNAFAPYTSINTNLLFFTKGEKTKEIWFYEHPYPEGRKSYTMTDPIQIEEFESEKKWWKKRIENDYAWKVSIDEIVAREYNLDFKNPNAKVETIKSPDVLLAEYREKQTEVNEVLSGIKDIIEDALKHHGN
ncbi:MAG: class I SAM-dependent DNA methyltransferase [Candidatus Paceibacterota bacterium]